MCSDFIQVKKLLHFALIYSEIPLPAFALVYLVYFCLFIYLVILN